MNNILAYFGGFLAVVLASLFAVPAFIDWNGYRGVFEEEASKVLGRDVRVGGGVNLRLLPTPYVKFEKVRLADISGQTGEPFIRVENFAMRLSGPALLRGVFEATEIELNKPVLTLALDGAGSGNWNKISLHPGALPFIPRDVTLRSVKLIDGAVTVYATDAAVVTRIERINGELSADAIQGPFRFKGSAQWSGAEREVRFATSDIGADGGFRVKAFSRAPATGNTFTLDAHVDNFTKAPTLKGDLTGRLVVPGAGAATKVGGKSGDNASDQAPAMTLKSKLTADASTAALSEIMLSLENAAEPQFITGSASATWIGAPRLEVALASKWLDLDRLAGAGQDSAPFPKFKQIALGIISAVAGEGAAAAKIDIDQVKIGGETAGGLKIDAERRDAVVRLKELRVGLPGGTRLGLFGDIKSGESGSLSFDGESFVSGTSLARLKTWAEKSGAKIDVGADGVFSAEGKVRLSDRRFELTEASAEVGGRPMTGEIKIIEDGRRRAEITVESAELERSDLFPEMTKALEAAVRKAVGVPAGSADKPASDDSSRPDMDIRLRILAGQLKRGSETYRDVDATVALENGDVRVPSAKFTTASGLEVTVEGRVDHKAAAPFGRLAFDAAAATPAAIRDLVRMFGFESLIAADRVEHMGSAKLAGIVRLGERSPTSADVSVDGLIGAARISAKGAFDAGLAEWRRQPSELRVVITAEDIRDLAASLGAVTKPAQASGANQSVELILTTVGGISAGAAARLDVTGEGVAIGYDGAIVWPEGAALDAAGQWRLAARDLTSVLVLAGMPQSSGVSGIAVKGAGDVERKAGAWTLSSTAVSVGPTTLSGSLTLATGADGGVVVGGDLNADHVTIAGLLAPIVEPSAGAAAATEAPLATGPAAAGGSNPVEETPHQPSWPSGRFIFSALDGVNGDIALKFARMTVGDSLQVRSGSMAIGLEPGKLAITKFTGSAAGGDVVADVKLQSSPSGVTGNAKLDFSSVELSKLGASARGKASLDLTLSGQALSPAALIASLSGSGRASLDDARVAGPSHAAARSVVDAVLQGKITNEPQPVTTALRDALSSSSVDLGARAVDLTVTNGVASIAPITLEDNAGATTAAASLDLGSWDMTSLWKVAPRPTAPTAIPGLSSVQQSLLPPASIAFNGRLDDLAAMASTIEASTLQRELTVRQLERNVEDLERLRRTDEERVRVDRERRKALQDEKARAAAEARSRRNGEQLPPILPESNGADQKLPPADQAEPTASPNGPAQSNAPPASGPPSERTIDIGQPSASGAVTDPAAAQSVDGDAVPPVSDAALETSDRPAYKPRPTRPAAPKRTSNDEVLRSLGGIP